MTGHGTGEPSMSLGAKIRAIRMERGMSLRQLAEKVGCSPPFISDIELVRRFPSEATLASIAETLAIDIHELEKHDSREALSTLKQLAQTDPKWTFALRKQTNRIAEGKLTAESLMKKLLEDEEDAR